MTSFDEINNSPYYKYLAMGSRTLSMNLRVVNLGFTNEFDYAENCVGENEFIDMPALEGAVHIEHCINDYICQLPFSIEYST